MEGNSLSTFYLVIFVVLLFCNFLSRDVFLFRNMCGCRVRVELSTGQKRSRSRGPPPSWSRRPREDVRRRGSPPVKRRYIIHFTVLFKHVFQMITFPTHCKICFFTPSKYLLVWQSHSNEQPPAPANHLKSIELKPVKGLLAFKLSRRKSF